MGLLRQFPHLSVDNGPVAATFRAALDQAAGNPVLTKKTLTDIVSYATRTAQPTSAIIPPIRNTGVAGILKSPFGLTHRDISRAFNPALIQEPFPEDPTPQEQLQQQRAEANHIDEPSKDEVIAEGGIDHQSPAPEQHTEPSAPLSPPAEVAQAHPITEPTPAVAPKQPKRKRAPTPPPPALAELPTSARKRKPVTPAPPTIHARTKQALAEKLAAQAAISTAPTPKTKQRGGRKKKVNAEVIIAA